MQTLTFLFTTSFYPPYHVGGACVHVKYLAEELARRGHEVHVMHSLDAYKLKRGNHLPACDEEDCTSVSVHTIESPFKKLDPLMVYTLGNSFHVKKKFSELIKNTNPDVVHHHNLSLLGYNILHKERTYPSIYTAHDFWLICPTNNLLRNKEEICREKSCFSCAINSRRPPQLWRSVKNFRKAISDIDLIIAPSDYLRRRIAKEIHIPAVTIPNFVPVPSENSSPIDDSPYFLFVGMLEKHKGIKELLELFKEFRSEINTKLIIAGEGSLENYVKDFIKRNSLDELVSYIGFVSGEKLYSLYKGASAVIIPSICPENSPLVALESLSVGTPVISSNTGGLPEIVATVDKNLIFSDRMELKNIISTFSKNKFSSNRIKEIYAEHFSPTAYINKYIRTIQSINSP
jgi:glycosyltransferase involved in cell wall biosynthesis